MIPGTMGEMIWLMSFNPDKCGVIRIIKKGENLLYLNTYFMEKDKN